MNIRHKIMSLSEDVPNIRFFDQLEDIMYESEDDTNINENIQLPVEPEDITSTSQLLELIQFIKDNKLYKKNKAYKNLVKGEDAIKNIDELIGMDNVKADIVTQLMALAKPTRNKANINTALYGDPGCGKTTLAHLLSDVYIKFGVISKGHFIMGDRANMIGQWVGETVQKTQKLLTKALGGILFIDEVYQFGCHQDGNRDPFAKECIDYITKFITEHEGELIIIVAGYEDEVQLNFFGQNQGLDRRFPWSYSISSYKPDQLCKIFTQQCKKNKYIIEEGALDESLFKETAMFKHGGGDTRSMLDKCIMIHEKRTISRPKEQGILTLTDITKGFKLHQEHKNKNTKTNELTGDALRMYG